jgi:hypothetical protein
MNGYGGFPLLREGMADSLGGDVKDRRCRLAPVFLPLLLLMACASPAPPAPPPPAVVCPPPPPSLLCEYGPKVVAASDTWIGRHLLSADHQKLIADFGRVVTDVCGSETVKAARASMPVFTKEK